MPYDLLEHRHRFAVWAGARAAQRAFTSVENLRDALEATNIRAFLENPESLNVDQEGYEQNHRCWCRQIVDFLEERGVPNVTFGRAAKLVAVYVKAMIVTSLNAPTNLAMNAHPPIDRVLLRNLANSPEVEFQDRHQLRTLAWTQLDEGDYYALVGRLREVIRAGEPFWKLEEHWTVTNE